MEPVDDAHKSLEGLEEFVREAAKFDGHKLRRWKRYEAGTRSSSYCMHCGVRVEVYQVAPGGDFWCKASDLSGGCQAMREKGWWSKS